MDTSLEALAQQELKPDESLVWMGCCKGKRRDQCRASGPVGNAIGGGIAGLVLGVIIAKVFTPDSPAILLLTIPLVAVLTTRGSVASFRRNAAVYALTDRRLFTCSKLYRTTSVRSLPLDALGTVFVDYRDYDRHTLHFHALASTGHDSPEPYLRFRLLSNQANALSSLRKLKPYVESKPFAAVAKPERRTIRLRNRLRRRHT